MNVKESSLTDTQREAFKVSVLDGFGDNHELRCQGEGLIDELLDEHGEAGVELAIERLEGYSGRKKGLRLFYKVIWLVCVPLFLMGTFEKFLVWDGLYRYSWMDDGKETIIAKNILKELSAEELILLKGDELAATKDERWKALWELDTSNPAYYMAYVRGYLSEHETLPDDFVETGESLDPGNGLYSLFAAAQLAEESTERSKTWSKGDLIRKKFEITDESKYLEARALFYKALEAPRYQSYEIEIMKDRMALFPTKGLDTVSRLTPYSYLNGAFLSAIKVRNVIRIMNIEAGRIIKSNDVDDFEGLKQRHLKIIEMVNDDSMTLLNILVTISMWRDSVDLLSEVAFFYGLSDEEALFDRVLPPSSMSRSAGKTIDRPDLGETHAILFLGLERGVVNGSDDKLSIKAGRLAGHDFWGRMAMFTASVFFLLVILGVVLARLRYAGVLKSLSIRMMDAVGVRENRVMVVLGALLPLSYYYVINELSPMSARDFGAHYDQYFISGGQFLAFILLALSFPILLAKQRWHSQLAMLGVKRGVLDYMAVLCSVIAMPLIGWHGYEGAPPSELVMYTAAGLLGITLLLLLCLVAAALWKSGLNSVGRLMIGHAVTPVYALVAALMLITVPLYHASEKRWVAKDELVSYSEVEPGFTPYEYRQTQKMKKQLTEKIKELRTGVSK